VTTPRFLFETDRLGLRLWAPDDARDAFAIYGDAQVMRYLGNTPPHTDLDATRVWLDALIARTAHRTDGRGGWAMVEKATGVAVGTLLLKELPDATPEKRPTEDVEIGWHLRRDRWGRGYATEAARVVLAHAFDTLRLPIVRAVVDPDNLPSQAVAKRLGMRHVGRTRRYYAGVEVELFERTRDEA
jgi:RimJ/RimL family protein N-acetyltransferase